MTPFDRYIMPPIILALAIAGFEMYQTVQSYAPEFNDTGEYRIFYRNLAYQNYTGAAPAVAFLAPEDLKALVLIDGYRGFFLERPQFTKATDSGWLVTIFLVVETWDGLRDYPVIPISTFWELRGITLFGLWY